jgi:hypothetical protein
VRGGRPLGTSVVFQIELADSTGMQVPAEAIGLDLARRCAYAPLRAPPVHAVSLRVPGGFNHRAEERVHADAVAEVAVVPVILVRDPGERRTSDTAQAGKHRGTGLGEVVVLGKSAPAELVGRLEGARETKVFELTHPVLAPSARAEEKSRELIGGQDLVFEKGGEDSAVSFVERQGERVKVGFSVFCCEHRLGTLHPPFR